MKKDEVAIVGKIGIKKKVEIADYSLKNNIRLFNLNSKKFLEKIEEKKQEKKQKESKRQEKKKEKEIKVKETEKKEESKDESILFFVGVILC